MNIRREVWSVRESQMDWICWSFVYIISRELTPNLFGFSVYFVSLITRIVKLCLFSPSFEEKKVMFRAEKWPHYLFCIVQWGLEDAILVDLWATLPTLQYHTPTWGFNGEDQHWDDVRKRKEKQCNGKGDREGSTSLPYGV